MKELCLAHIYILFHHQQQPALQGYIALLVMLSLAVSPAAAEKEQLTQPVTWAERSPAAVLWGHRRHLSSVSFAPGLSTVLLPQADGRATKDNSDTHTGITPSFTKTQGCTRCCGIHKSSLL